LGAGAVPVINENDSVATEEIRFGDNDRLAARVAQAAGATGVILLSDVDGLFDRAPHLPGAVLLPSIDKIDGRVRVMVAEGSSSGMGSGGMASKLDAADIATRAGIGLVIASGLRDHPLAVLEQGGPATFFAPREGGSARKSWLGGRLTVKGRIRIDDGAVQALKTGSSLLPAGALSVEGEFKRGDVIDISTDDGIPIARGLSEYDAVDAARICGHRSSELAGILRTVPRSVLVHRDQLVLL
jgi:glutamate 5-kinase